MASDDRDGDESGSGNDPLDQAEWEFCVKSGYEYGGDYEDDLEVEARAQEFRKAFKAMLAAASPGERAVLKAALARVKRGQEVNWEALARDLGQTSGAVKTQIRRAAAKLLRRNG